MDTKKFKLSALIVALLLCFNTYTIFASSNILKIEMSEKVYENITYNSLTGENINSYQIQGEILVSNIHSSESIENIKLNFTNILDIYNLTYNSGNLGFISDFNLGGNSAQLLIPDLGPQQNTSFIYLINTTSITNPINFSTNYNEFSVFAGSSFNVSDTITNTLNSSQYVNNCIYNISINQQALEINQSFPVNFEFIGPVSGTDSSNTVLSADNRTLNWSVSNNGCLNSGLSSDINYYLKTPVGVDLADDYDFSNSNIKYQFNDTISRIDLTNIHASGDLELEFQKYQVNVLTGDNATWKITSSVDSSSDFLVNLDKVTLWVSQRNGTGTGFTNPALIDQDTISGENLTNQYIPNQNLNSTLPSWDNIANEWFFNYTFSSSPIVWMDLENTIVNDGIQLTNRSVSYAENQVFIKEIHVATGYWLEIQKNITRISEGNFNVFIKVSNLGSSVTPTNQAVVVYNFIPNTFTLTSNFDFSSSTWYSTQSTNQTLNDITYNGTMHQYALLANTNPFNSSLDLYGGSETDDNTWTVSYNVSGSGEFKFDDLFLTGVDPLNVGEIGGTKSITTKSEYKSSTSFTSYILPSLATLVGILVLLL
jgi:hypothetical protein